VLVAGAAIALVTHTDSRSARGTGTPESTTTTGPSAKTPASAVQFTPTSRYAGLTFDSPEGAVPSTNGLRVLDWKCLDEVPGTQLGATRCEPDSWAWYVVDANGAMLWFAHHAPGQSTVMVVDRALSVSFPPAGTQLHFADGNGHVLALVGGTTDASYHWTNVVAAWTLDPATGDVSPRSTDGVRVLDQCAQFVNLGGKTPVECLSPHPDAVHHDAALQDPAESAVAQGSTIRTCGSGDLSNVGIQYDGVLGVGYLHGIRLQFANDSGTACLLRSYPRVFVASADGTWSEVATSDSALEAVSSFAWTGAFPPTGSAPTAPPVELGLRLLTPAFGGPGSCPASLPDTTVSGVRLLLRSGSTVDVRLAQPFELGGCALEVTRWGFVSTDGPPVS